MVVHTTFNSEIKKDSIEPDTLYGLVVFLTDIC